MSQNQEQSRIQWANGANAAPALKLQLSYIQGPSGLRNSASLTQYSGEMAQAALAVSVESQDRQEPRGTKRRACECEQNSDELAEQIKKLKTELDDQKRKYELQLKNEHNQYKMDTAAKDAILVKKEARIGRLKEQLRAQNQPENALLIQDPLAQNQPSLPAYREFISGKQMEQVEKGKVPNEPAPEAGLAEGTQPPTMQQVMSQNRLMWEENRDLRADCYRLSYRLREIQKQLVPEAQDPSSEQPRDEDSSKDADS